MDGEVNNNETFVKILKSNDRLVQKSLEGLPLVTDFIPDDLSDASSSSDDEKTEMLVISLKKEDWLWNYSSSGKNLLLRFRTGTLALEPCIRDARKTEIKMPAKQFHMAFKALQGDTKLLAKILEAHGLAPVSHTSNDFNILWTGSHVMPDALKNLTAFQRVNHFPRSSELTRKDRLYKNIEIMQQTKGFKNFDFIPQTFIMPSEYRELCNAHYRTRGPWIVKPAASSRGRGIHIVNAPDQIAQDESVVVAKYIANPLLVGNHKCDLRLYVLVTSYNPLLLYLYEEGLVRFATVPYDNSTRHLWNPCMHLCNYSINKYHCDYIKSNDPTVEDVGHKWTLSALLRHLRAKGHDTAQLMEKIEDMIVKTILSSTNTIVTACRMFVPHVNNCFELYGFDILIDDSLKPWLIEVNLSPSLGCDSPLDIRLKSAVLVDMFNLVGVPAVDPIVHTTTGTGLVRGNKTTRTTKSRADLISPIHMSLKKPVKSKLSSTSMPCLSTEESKILRIARAQFERRGGFVRIFPTSNSWQKYSYLLDSSTGIPAWNRSNNSGLFTYSNNYNLLIHSNLFPTGKNIKAKLTDKSNSTNTLVTIPLVAALNQNGERIYRYERMLKSGYNCSIDPVEDPESGESSDADSERSRVGLEKKSEILRLLENRVKLTQGEARRIFSAYLVCVLKKIVQQPGEKEMHMEIVMRFLQRACAQLRTPYFVKMPNSSLVAKDRSAIVAKQLNDFMLMYNRETELYADAVDRSNHVPNVLVNEFLDHAKEQDLEEVLLNFMEQSRKDNTKVQPLRNLQVLMRCIPVNTNAKLLNTACPNSPVHESTRARVFKKHSG